MKKKNRTCLYPLLLTLFFLVFACQSVFGAVLDDGKIVPGIYAGDMELAGLTPDEARAMIKKYIDSLLSKNVTLESVDGHKVTVKAVDLGLGWGNEQLVDESFQIGRGGNIVRRFKQLKDLEREPKKYRLELVCDRKKIEKIIKEKCCVYDVYPVDATLERSGGKFSVVEGNDGLQVDVDASVSLVKTYMEEFWSRKDDGYVSLKLVETPPKHSADELSEVKDVLGTFTTSFSTSASGRSANVRNGCAHVNDRVLYPGEMLSVYDCVSPFTEENGYYLAGSYNRGLVVETLGGGICQVSSTLYNAVIRAELKVNERSNHSMVVNYVDLSADAAISGTSKDFKFTNSTDYPIYIAGSTSEDKQITFTIYGKETRPEGRKLSFETEIISESEPGPAKLIGDPSQSVGYIHSQSAHTGYSANYWKIIKENGTEVSREKINSSYYQAVPRTVTFGTAGDATGAMSAAISTGNVEHCKAVANNLINAANAANIAAAEAAANAAANQAID